MTLATYLLFLPACFALNMAFGPNNLLSVGNGARWGVGPAVVAALGRLLAFALMITVAGVGMGALLAASALAFNIVKWLGAAYLIWLGIKLLRAPAPEGLADATDTAQAPDLRALARQEFAVAIGNPKAILIFTAFFPQFVAPGDYWGSFTVLGITFLILEVIAIAIYAYAGTRLSGVMKHARGLRWINRISGGTMIAFGAVLAVAKRPTA